MSILLSTFSSEIETSAKICADRRQDIEKRWGKRRKKDTTINLSLTKIDQFYFSSYNTPWNVGKNHFGRKNLALQILSDNHFFAKKFRKLPIFALEEIKLKKMQLFQC